MDKLKKLLRLARDPGAHEGERLNALKMAEALALKLGVDLEGVAASLDHDFDPRDYNSKTTILRDSTANIFVELVCLNVSERWPDVVINWSRHPGGPRRMNVALPKPELPDEAIRMIKLQLRHMDIGWRKTRQSWKAMKKADRFSFMVGCAKGMSEILMTQMWKDLVPSMFNSDPDSSIQRMKARHIAKGDDTKQIDGPAADPVPSVQESLHRERKTQPRNRGLLLNAPADEPEEPKEKKPQPPPLEIQRESWAHGYQFGRTIEL